MIKINKNTNKRAFTLLELVLAIAIIVLVSSVFLSLVISIRDSYKKVYNNNDSTDYAALYSQAIENYSLKFCQGAYNNDIFIYVSDNANLAIDKDAIKKSTNPSDHLFYSEPAQLKDTNGQNKWLIFIDKDSIKYSNGVLSYTLIVLDNYSYKKELGSSAIVLQQEYEASFWIPHNESLVISADAYGNKITYYGLSSNGGTRKLINEKTKQPGAICIKKPA